MAVIDNIVNVTVSVSEAAPESQAFSRIWLLGTKGTGTQEAFKWYGDLDEIVAGGWANTTPVYKAAKAAFANGADGLYITPYNAETGTALTTLLDNARNYGGWYGLVTVGVATSAYATITSWCDTNHKLFGFAVADNAQALNPAGTTSEYTFGIVYPAATDNEYIHVAWMARCFGFEPGTETWAYKTLNGIVAGNYSTTQIANFKTAGVNCYATVAGRDVTLSGYTVSDEWIDIMRYIDYLASDIQARVYGVLAANTKIPYTAAGLVAIESAVRVSLANGQSVGAIAEADYADGEVVPGYTVTVPDIATISAATRHTRILSGVKFTARLTGAIHVVQIVGTLSE